MERDSNNSGAKGKARPRLIEPSGLGGDGASPSLEALASRAAISRSWFDRLELRRLRSNWPAKWATCSTVSKLVVRATRLAMRWCRCWR